MHLIELKAQAIIDANKAMTQALVERNDLLIALKDAVSRLANEYDEMAAKLGMKDTPQDVF